MQPATYTDVRDADVLAAQDVIARYWAIVDGTLDAPVGPCFTDDAFLQIEDLVVQGRAMLTEAVGARTARAVAQGRATRHLVTNAVVRSYAGDELVIAGLITVFSGLGERPAPTLSSVGDFTYRCVRTGTGAWQIARLEGAIVFAGGDSPYARPAPSAPPAAGARA